MPRVFDAAGVQEAEQVLEGRVLRLWREKENDTIPAVSLRGHHTRLDNQVTNTYGTSIKLESVKDENGKPVDIFGISMDNHSMDKILEDATSKNRFSLI